MPEATANPSSPPYSPTRRLRTLSKSDFTLACTCPAKLYFRENGYPDTRDSDPYLRFLAEGGYMVEALAKARYPDGVQLTYGRDAAADYAMAREFLERRNATLFETTLLLGRRLARVDILEKRGDEVRLIEVKAKSFDGAEHAANLRDGGKGVFRGKRKPHAVVSDWMPKLLDVTYQVLLLERAFPGLKVTPFLALVDKSKRAAVDGIPSLFDLVMAEGRDGTRRLQTARYVGSPELVPQLDLITEVDVSAEVDSLRAEVEAMATRFESMLDAPFTEFTRDLERGTKCGSCEFHDADAARSGFHQCWGTMAEGEPHFLELHAVGNAKGPDGTSLIDWMWANGKSEVIDVPLDGLAKADGTVGPQALRQRRQVEHTRSGATYVDPTLRDRIEALTYPAHFIDFETSRLALPSHAKMRPYGVVTFQWSCHTLAAPGARPTHKEWLNTVDLWPNETFARTLRDAVGDDGAIVVWSPFENTTLKQIVADLAEFGRHDPELVAWMQRIEDRIVDLHLWTKESYYHPLMGGRTSIKVVMDAMWKTDPAMRAQFVEWADLPADEAVDPYQALPPSIVAGAERVVREGTGAMRAYDAMMYGPDRGNADVVDQWARLLKQYCELDTLSMVLILEHWRRQVGLA
jgi:hypothetical protein